MPRFASFLITRTRLSLTLASILEVESDEQSSTIINSKFSRVWQSTLYTEDSINFSALNAGSKTLSILCQTPNCLVVLVGRHRGYLTDQTADFTFPSLRSAMLARAARA